MRSSHSSSSPPTSSSSSSFHHHHHHHHHNHHHPNNHHHHHHQHRRLHHHHSTTTIIITTSTSSSSSPVTENRVLMNLLSKQTLSNYKKFISNTEVIYGTRSCRSRHTQYDTNVFLLYITDKCINVYAISCGWEVNDTCRGCEIKTKKHYTRFNFIKDLGNMT